MTRMVRSFGPEGKPFSALLLACTLGMGLAFGVVPAKAGTLIIGTGAAGGTFADYGQGVAQVASELAGKPTQAKNSGGSNDNLTQIEAGTLKLGLAAMGPAYEAWTGTGTWTKGQAMKNIRALVPMYETPFHLIALSASSITDVKQLEGKRLGVGPGDGPSFAIFRAFFKEAGIKPDYITGSPSEHAGQLLSGGISAIAFGAGVPIGAFAEVEQKAPARIFGLSDPDVAVMQKLFPYMSAYTLEAGSYKTQTLPVRTVAMWNFVVASKDLTDATAYAIVKAVFENPMRMQAAHPAAAATRAVNAKQNGFLPFHPGAIRYYKENGIVLQGSTTP